MIPRPGAPKQDTSTPEAPELKVTEVTDLVFNFGPNDSIDWVLEEGDRFEHDEDRDRFRLIFTDGETITVDGFKVRWWSEKRHKVAVPVTPYAG